MAVSSNCTLTNSNLEQQYKPLEQQSEHNIVQETEATILIRGQMFHISDK